MECALKACIAKRTREFDFPDKSLVIESHTHSLKELFRLAQVKDDWNAAVIANPALMASWNLLQRMLPMNHPMIESLRSLFSSAIDTRGMRLGGQMFGDKYLEDAVVYRIK